MNLLKVVIADDHAILGAGLRLLIDAQPDMAVVAEAARARRGVFLSRRRSWWS